MSVEVGIIRGASLNEIKKRDFNIYVGISLGNKWFTKEHIRECLLFALQYTKARAGLLVADSLHAINYEVRNRARSDKAYVRALKEGEKIVSMLEGLVSELPPHEQGKVDIIRWDDVKRNQDYGNLINILNGYFKENKDFREAILEIVKDHVSKEDRVYEEQEMNHLSEYVLEELPENVNGFRFNKTYYDCFLEPADNKLARFIDNLVNQKIFPEMGMKIIKGHNTFVELKITP